MRRQDAGKTLSRWRYDLLTCSATGHNGRSCPNGRPRVRKRILAVALSAVLLALTVFGVPLAVLLQRMVVADEQGELERLALRAAVVVAPTYTAGDPIELPQTEAEVTLAVYDPRGRKVTGRGPEQLDHPLASSLRGTIVELHDSDLEVAVPVSSNERVIAVIRASSPASALNHRIWWSWAAMAAIGLVAAAAAWLLARRQSTILARPLTDLERVAHELGDGNFGARAQPSGVFEIDEAGQALNRTADRLQALITRQRSFIAHASHQLRTPLTRLRLELEDGLGRGPESLDSAVREALTSAETLSQTVDDILEVARGQRSRDSFSVATLLDGLRQAWHGTLAASDRPLRLTSEPGLTVAASLPAARQALNTLVDNAYRHGRGVVEVRARDIAGIVAIDVIDEGGHTKIAMSTGVERPAGEPSRERGLGLALARTLAEAEGGRLTFASDEDQTRFTLLLPSPHTEQRTDGR